jgi:membrane-bound lytic murein transglycosylase D
LWERIRAGYAIPDLSNKLVDNQLTWYSTRTDYILRTVQRGSRYLYHVVEELEKRGMPSELALLPFIESAFNPQAISTAKASGMWQFMAATGKDFNLKQNMFKDDRRGVLDSTDAALNYLERLYGMFGDWQLALAAYNWGEGSVQRAIKKQQALGLPVDFDSMSALMPAETRNYLPKLQAVKNIIGHPEQFNIALPKLENQPYFVTVEKPGILMSASLRSWQNCQWMSSPHSTRNSTARSLPATATPRFYYRQTMLHCLRKTSVSGKARFQAGPLIQ